MDAITSLFESFDLATLIPKADAILENISKITNIVLLVGPVLLLVLGLIYLFLAPREANHRFGFRTWFGMGSVQAWRFTQRLAGLVWSVLGLGLTIFMLVRTANLAGADPVETLSSAITCLLWQVGLVLVSYIGICLVVTVCFDRHGNKRRFR